jgi:hypothetical protein
LKQDKTQMAAICGLYCGICPCYLACRENDAEELRKASKRTGVPAEKIRCDGCLSDRVMPHCVECRHGFRSCAAEKKITWCFQCDEFPCTKLEDFLDIHIENGISHHAQVIDNLRYMKARGVEKWVEKQEKANRCPECGKRLYWSTRECSECHAKVR